MGARTVLLEPLPFLVAGEWRSSGQTRTIRSPYDGQPVGEVCVPTEKDVEDALSAAVQAYEQLRRMSAYERSVPLEATSRGIAQAAEEFARSLALEIGKPIKAARAEVQRAVTTFRWGAEEARRMVGEVIPLDTDPGAPRRLGIVQRFPLGVVLAITPFNFPLNLAAHKVAPAIASGNAVVLKPATAAPITALRMAKLLVESGRLPAGALSVLPVSAQVAERILQDPRIKKLSFTGSAEVGWHLKSLVPKKHVTLELGGNAAVVIEPDADLELAVERVTVGGYAFSGQSCISVQRVYVHEDIYDRFLDMFTARVKALKMGDPLDEETDVGPLIDEEAAKRVEAWVEEARRGGARVLVGGRRHGSFYEPTVIVDAKPDMKVCCRELFGPVVVVGRYRDFREALRAVNDSVYGLQAGVFTSNLDRAFLAFRELEVGGVTINEMPTYRTEQMPYGGVKESGFGREGLRYAIEAMTEPRLMVIHLPER